MAVLSLYRILQLRKLVCDANFGGFASSAEKGSGCRVKRQGRGQFVSHCIESSLLCRRKWRKVQNKNASVFGVRRHVTLKLKSCSNSLISKRHPARSAIEERILLLSVSAGSVRLSSNAKVSARISKASCHAAVCGMGLHSRTVCGKRKRCLLNCMSASLVARGSLLGERMSRSPVLFCQSVKISHGFLRIQR